MKMSDPLRMSSVLPTWEILKQYVEEQIGTGVYPVGSWLPSVRELAAELNVNRNTVSKVYQALGRDGVLEVERGKGVRVAAKPAEGRTAESRIELGIASIMREASLAGVSREWVLERVAASAEAAFGNRLVRLGFVECTMPDARQLAGDLSGFLNVSVTPVDLAELEREPQLAEQFDLVTTTFFHLQEVSAILPADTEPIGIHHAVSHESVLEIAKLRRGSTIVIVCPNSRTLERVRTIVETYAHGHVYSYVVDDRKQIERALGLADVAVDISATHDLVSRLAPDLPTITVSFHIERQSIDYLRDVVQRLAGQLATGGGRKARGSRRGRRAATS